MTQRVMMKKQPVLIMGNKKDPEALQNLKLKNTMYIYCGII